MRTPSSTAGIANPSTAHTHSDGVGDAPRTPLSDPSSTQPLSTPSATEHAPAANGGPMFGMATSTVTTFTTTCGREWVIAGTMDSSGIDLADCAAMVGLDPTPTVTAKVGETVYIQVEGATKPDDGATPSGSANGYRLQFTASPASAVTVKGWTITPRSPGIITVDVTGLSCQLVGPKLTQPATCRLMAIDAR